MISLSGPTWRRSRKAQRICCGIRTQDEFGDRVLSAGASEISTLGGRPAIVSVKPIVSDSGNITQTVDETYLHVSIRYLDKSFIADLERDYLFCWPAVSAHKLIASRRIQLSSSFVRRKHHRILHLAALIAPARR